MTAALLCAVAALAWRDSRSEAAQALRSGAPILALLSLDSPGGEPGKPAEPYLLVYHSRERTLDLVDMPSRPGPGGPPRQDEKDRLAEALGHPLPEPCLRLRWTMPQNLGRSPSDVKAWIASWRRDALFPVAALRAARSLRRRGLDLSWYDAALFALEAYRLKPGGIHLSRLDRGPQAPLLLNRLLTPGEARDLRPDEAITVDVLNSSGEPGVALRATKVLRWQGFDVVGSGNAPKPAGAVVMIDNAGRPERARRVAEALGCPDAEVVTEMAHGLRVDVRAFLGRDYRRCKRLSPQ